MRAIRRNARIEIPIISDEVLADSVRLSAPPRRKDRCPNPFSSNPLDPSLDGNQRK